MLLKTPKALKSLARVSLVTAGVSWGDPARISASARLVQTAKKGQRVVKFAEEGRLEDMALERELLPAEFTASGPLIIENPSPALVHPGQQLCVDELGLLHTMET